jgi:hypothetical protein
VLSVFGRRIKEMIRLRPEQVWTCNDALYPINLCFVQRFSGCGECPGNRSAKVGMSIGSKSEGKVCPRTGHESPERE